jgi:hypothetical protein
VSDIIVKKQVTLLKNVIKVPKQMHHLLDLLVKDKSPQEYVLTANVAIIGLMNISHKAM